MSIKIKSVLYCCIILFVSVQLSAQNKDIDKGKEKLKDAFEQKDATKRNEGIQKAVELFQKGGLKREMYVLIGDAFLEHGDLTQAEAKYGQCDKVEKAEGYKKVAQAYADLAFSGEEKTQKKNLDNAMKRFDKAGKHKDGGTYIGDKFYEKGEQYYGPASDYYFIGSDTPNVIKIAKDYEKKGKDGVTPAFDLYKKAAMYKKAGDLAWGAKLYIKAYDAYSAGEVTEGMRKCADMFYSLGQETEAQNIYVKMVETYAKTANTEAIEKLATENVNTMNYGLAARIYDKAGNLAQATRYSALNKLMNLDLDSAKMLLSQSDQQPMIKAIDANMKSLAALHDVKMQFDDWVKQQPNVDIELDPETNKYKPAAKDEQILVDYYKLLKDKITDQCQIISKNVNTITNPELKKIVMKRFLDYPAVGKILDKNNFTVRLTKATSQVKDVYLKKM